MKSRGKRGGWCTLGFPVVCVLCIFVFFLGFFCSSLLSHEQVENELRVLNEKEYEPLPQGNSGDDALTTIPFQVLSWKPRVQYFPGFATAQQCENIIKMAKGQLVPSTLALREGDTDESTKGVRTSSGTFLSAYQDQTGTLDLVEKKIERATMIPRNYGEPFNVLRYEIGQKYLQHHDTFNPTEYGPQRSQRLASFLLYLSDVEEGGETAFPLENGESKGANHDYGKCNGLKVKPRKGDGLLFYSLYPNGTIDQASLHGGCAVIKGQKWVATKWIRNQEEFY